MPRAAADAAETPEGEAIARRIRRNAFRRSGQFAPHCGRRRRIGAPDAESIEHVAVPQLDAGDVAPPVDAHAVGRAAVSEYRAASAGRD